MPATCYSILRGKRIRVTALDECGAPNAAMTANSLVTSSGFVTVQYAIVYEEGTDYTQRNADDELCVNERGDDRIKRVEATITLCNVDPDLVTLLTGNPVEVDGAGNNVGFRLDEAADVSNFAFELWSGVAGNPCAGSAVPYGYFLLPWMHNGTLRDHTVENGVTNLEIFAFTKAGSLWGAGPYNVVASGPGGTPSALEDPITPTQHYLQRYTTVAPPAAMCGLQAMPAAPTPAGS